MHDHRIPLRSRDGSIVAHALIDQEDAANLAGYRWCRNNNGYAAAAGGVLMHRLILGLVSGDGLCCDHINRDKLDNRRSNLRVVTHAQNQQNRASNAVASSRFRGVHWARKQRKWRARATLNHVFYHLGYFDDERAAAEAVEAFRQESMPYAEPDPALAA